MAHKFICHDTKTSLISPFFQTKDFYATMIKHFSASSKNEDLRYVSITVFKNYHSIFKVFEISNNGSLNFVVKFV